MEIFSAGENACPSVPLLPHGFDCPFQNEKVKGCLRQFFSMLPIADPQAEAHGSTEKNKPLTISFFHFQSHPRGSKLHCISGEIHARIYPLDKWLSLTPPKWASELSAKGYVGRCAIDFYDDIFALRSKYFRLWQSLGSPRGLNAPFRKRVHGDAFPLNQYHSPLGRGSKPLSCPSRGSVGRSIPSRSFSPLPLPLVVPYAPSLA